MHVATRLGFLEGDGEGVDIGAYKKLLNGGFLAFSGFQCSGSPGGGK